MPPTKLENAVKVMEIINVMFPTVAGVMVMLKGGKSVDLKELLDDTNKFAEGKINEANEFLDRPGSSGG